MTPLAQRVIQMAKELTPPHEIAAHEGVTPSRVHKILSTARARGEQVPKFKNGCALDQQLVSVERPKHIVIGVRLYGLIEQAAARRGKSPSEYARDVLEADALRKEELHG